MSEQQTEQTEQQTEQTIPAGRRVIVTAVSSAAEGHWARWAMGREATYVRRAPAHARATHVVRFDEEYAATGEREWHVAAVTLMTYGVAEAELDRRAQVEAKAAYDRLVAVLLHEAAERQWGHLLVDLFDAARLPMPRLTTVQAVVELSRDAWPPHVDTAAKIHAATRLSLEQAATVTRMRLYRRVVLDLDVPADVEHVDDGTCRCNERGGSTSTPTLDPWIADAVVARTKAMLGDDAASWNARHQDVTLSCAYCH